MDRLKKLQEMKLIINDELDDNLYSINELKKERKTLRTKLNMINNKIQHMENHTGKIWSVND